VIAEIANVPGSDSAIRCVTGDAASASAKITQLASIK
jgi:hypothetical protein